MNKKMPVIKIRTRKEKKSFIKEQSPKANISSLRLLSSLNEVLKSDKNIDSNK